MPTNFDGAFTVAFGAVVPSGDAATVGSDILSEKRANQWIITLLATGGDVTIDTSIVDPILWWLVRGVWREDVLPLNIPEILTVTDGTGFELLMRARVDAEAVYLQIPAPVGGTLAVQVSPVLGGS